MLILQFLSNPEAAAYFVITLVVALTVHEFAHAWTAFQLGDDTAQKMGRLTLNPLKHLDPLGTIVMLVAGFGWAKPVPFNPYAVLRRTPAGPMLVAVAGPVSNLLMAIVASIPFRTGLLEPAFTSQGATSFASAFLQTFILYNLILMLFNLIPVAPLDGEKVLTYFLPPGAQAAMDRIRPYGPMLLLLVLLAGRGVFSALIFTPASRITQLLIP